ncbi:phage tail protein [Lysinibacillus pakistanensis]|uniref:Tail fiber protein n=1 Tax=Lysinibacillus pakistanensis TaxID=759811 RepID=A0AAX3WYK5_9BACI|nr:tail fiber protein [Lysinibacillus pakistanensis]MDM5231312.1 tail fiber protein [Lysinibacillus pakistanensis]WHY46860.1 tail fiber protein [Lysinibacillus pakistanensis]WHY51873.1 tail fiber protein [Lysinibacillus pakistanensis]
MSEAYIGEIRIFGGNFAPKDWALCDGQIINIATNSALYAILGNRYGGDGKTTFALPNLNGRAALHQGTGVGLTPRNVGESGGSATVTLLTTQMPSHNHIATCNNTQPSNNEPTGAIWTDQQGKGSVPLYTPQVNKQMNLMTMDVAGGSQPHNNMQPYLGLNFIICLYGDWPPKG